MKDVIRQAHIEVQTGDKDELTEAAIKKKLKSASGATTTWARTRAVATTRATRATSGRRRPQLLPAREGDDDQAGGLRDLCKAEETPVDLGGRPMVASATEGKKNVVMRDEASAPKPAAAKPGGRVWQRPPPRPTKPPPKPPAAAVPPPAAVAPAPAPAAPPPAAAAPAPAPAPAPALAKPKPHVNMGGGAGMGRLAKACDSRGQRTSATFVGATALPAELSGAGKDAGLEVWRVVPGGAPVVVPPLEHGKFFDGAAYVVLRTAWKSKLRGGTTSSSVHPPRLDPGLSASLRLTSVRVPTAAGWAPGAGQAAAAAAALALAVDEAFEAQAVQHREVQGTIGRLHAALPLG